MKGPELKKVPNMFIRVSKDFLTEERMLRRQARLIGTELPFHSQLANSVQWEESFQEQVPPASGPIHEGARMPSSAWWLWLKGRKLADEGIRAPFPAFMNWPCPRLIIRPLNGLRLNAFWDSAFV